MRVSWTDLGNMTYEDVVYLNELLEAYEDAEARAEDKAEYEEAEESP